MRNEITLSLKKQLAVGMAIVTGAWYLASARLPVHLRYRAVVPPVFSFVCIYSMWAYYAFQKMRRAGYHMRVHIWRRTVVARVIGSLTEEFDRTVNAALQLPSPSTRLHMFDLILTSVIALLCIVFVVWSTCIQGMMFRGGRYAETT
ncbi:hypothetical protein ABFS83_02G074300 [Erythranthe nasuta]